MIAGKGECDFLFESGPLVEEIVGYGMVGVPGDRGSRSVWVGSVCDEIIMGFDRTKDSGESHIGSDLSTWWTRFGGRFLWATGLAFGTLRRVWFRRGCGW